MDSYEREHPESEQPYPMPQPQDAPYVVEVPLILDFAATPAPLRLWSVFAAYGVILVVVLTASIPVGVVLLWQRWQPKMDERQLELALRQIAEHDVYRPAPFLSVLLLTQGGILAVTLLVGLLSRRPAAERLGMSKSTLPLWAYPFVIVSGPVVSLPVAALLDGLGFGSDASFEKVFVHVNHAQAALLITAMSLLPALAEELFFRGYMQRRLLERWTPAWSIAVTTVLFALMHVHPYSVLAILPVGGWLGVLAWRTGSIWPSAACHAFNNAAAGLYLMGTIQWGWPAQLPRLVEILLYCAGGLCFAVALWAVFRVAAPDVTSSPNGTGAFLSHDHSTCR
jgi:membrane protease YdiL (CAAX protease family)